MIKNPKLMCKIGEKKPNDMPEMYDNPKLFPRKKGGDRYTKAVDEVPDPQLEDIQPDSDEKPVAKAEPDTQGKLEGKFKVSLEEMIGKLNSIIEAEYSQWMRYYHYAFVLRGHCRDALAAEFDDHAEEELGHLERLAMRVIGLGGYPATTMEHPKPLRDTEDIIKELLRREQEGVELYRKILADCGDNEGTRQILEGNIEQEQEHIDDLWRFLKHPEMIKAIPGGLAEGKPDKDFDPVKLKAGIKIEMEHTKDKAIAREIAKDHLTEDPEYYTKLKQIEKATSAGKTTNPSEKQAKREYDHSFARFTGGVSGSNTPDKPERGRDWHGTVPGVPDEPQGDDEDEAQAEAQKYFKATKDAIKSLAMIPRFAEKPVLPPRAMEFMGSQGYSTEEVEDLGGVPPRLQAKFCKNVAKSIRSSLNRLSTYRG